MKWTKEENEALQNLKKDGKTNTEIAKKLNKSIHAVERKTSRMVSADDTTTYDLKKWTGSEMHQLYAYLQAKQSYKFIAQKLSRSPVSVERKSQKTDWKAWHLAFGDTENKNAKRDDKELLDRLSQALIVLTRHDATKLESISKDEFFKKINFDQEKIKITYEEILANCHTQLDIIGLNNPETANLNAGTYIIVGDSHGKHTRTKMFNLLKQVQIFTNAEKIIHLGHILDDDNDISYEWGNFTNLIVLAKKEELQLVQQQRNRFNFSYDIVRGGIVLGKDLMIMNQDLITDYVKTSIASLDQEIIDDKAIVNSHRLEFASKCSESNAASYYASPGCLCEPHIVKTIKQINFEDHQTVKRAFNDGFIKYRRMELLNKLWKNGLLVITVNENGDHTIVPCSIKKIGHDYVTSYFDKIITSNGVENPDKKIFVTGDMHSPKYSPEALALQEQIAFAYNADVLVNIGDAHDNHALNHHDMDRGRIIKSDILQDAAQTHFILKRMLKWAKKCHIIIGNHERFSEDFIAKYPQFSDYLDINFLLSLEDLGYKITKLKDILHIGPAKFIHGDMIMFGQNGNKLEKSSRTFGENIFIGHIHQPGIRFGCYSIGCSCKLDQGYNEFTASQWMHGFGLCNEYKGVAFPTTIALNNNMCLFVNKTFVVADDIDSWKVKSFTAKIQYSN